MSKRDECACRWVSVSLVDRRRPTHVRQVCDSCAPTEIEKLRIQVEVQVGLAADLRCRLDDFCYRSESGRQILVQTLTEVKRTAQSGLSRANEVRWGGPGD